MCPGDYIEFNEKFGFKRDVQWQTSVDTDVWPSVFDDFEEAELPDNALRPSVWCWFDLRRMRAFYAAKKKAADQHGGVPIAIELLSRDSLESDDDYWCGVLHPYSALVPDQIPPNWLFLGYDVADKYQVSSLTNCEYDQREQAELQTAWAAVLNEYGLFNLLEHAMDFREWSNANVREHAPFFVYGLFCDPTNCNVSHIRRQ
jgi:hypothetical protein